jgi:hypothetical protein
VFNVSRQEVERGVGSEVVSPSLVRERCLSRVVCTASSLARKAAELPDKGAVPPQVALHTQTSW